MIKSLSLALTALSIAAGPAAALSCIKPDPVAAYDYAAKSDQSFVVLKGSFDFSPNALPDPAGPPLEKIIAAEFKGKILTADGFTDEVEAPVSLALTCAGPWCGRISPNVEYVSFVLQTEDRLILDVGPCYQFAFAKPAEELVAQVEQCAAGGDCKPAQQ